MTIRNISYFECRRHSRSVETMFNLVICKPSGLQPFGLQVAKLRLAILCLYPYFYQAIFPTGIGRFADNH